MNINRHNYEAYLLDLLEGRLSVEEQQLLQNFLLLNPDCEGELKEIEPWILEGENVSYHKGGSLKKELPGTASILTDHNFDLFSIARMEGDLSEDQIAAHQAMVERNDKNARLWDEWKLTRIAPEAISFKGKDKLKDKKGQNNRVLWISVISAAAAMALVLVLFRMGPTLPQEELTVQTPLEKTIQQEEDVLHQPEMHVEVAEQVEEAPPLSNGNIMFSLKKEHDRPIEQQATLVVQRDDLQPRSLRISKTRLNTSSLAGMPVPDQIEPLYEPPVPIHLSSLSVAQISELDFQAIFEDYKEEKDISLWTIANAGIKGINRLAKSDISLMASKDEDGEISGFQLKSKRFSLSRPLGREE